MRVLSVSADRLLFLMNIQHLNGPSRGLWANIASLFRALIFYVTTRYLAKKLISSTVKGKSQISLSTCFLCPLHPLCFKCAQSLEYKYKATHSLDYKCHVKAWLHIVSCAGSLKKTFHCLPASPASSTIKYCIWNPWAQQPRNKTINQPNHLSLKHNLCECETHTSHMDDSLKHSPALQNKAPLQRITRLLRQDLVFYGDWRWRNDVATARRWKQRDVIWAQHVNTEWQCMCIDKSSNKRGVRAQWNGIFLSVVWPLPHIIRRKLPLLKHVLVIKGK